MNLRAVFTAVVLSATVASTLPAQDREDTRAHIRELREQIDELREELRDLERDELSDVAREFDITVAPFWRSANVVIAFAGNRARMGIVVQTRASVRTDSIGAVVVDVNEEGPAGEAGIEEGDIIVEFDGEPLTGRYPPASEHESAPAIKLIDLVGEHEEGDTVNVAFVRGGDRREVDMVLRRIMPHGIGEGLMSVFEDDEPIRFGTEVLPLLPPFVHIRTSYADLELVTLNEDLGQYFGTSDGVLVIRAPSEESLNLRGGDVILSIDGREVDDPSRVFRVLGTYNEGESVEIEIMRNGRQLAISATLPERSAPRMYRRRR